MNKVEDRTTDSYKAKERTFYSDQWIFNDRIKEQQKIIDNPDCSADEKYAATRQKKELENERRDSIDNWKKEHGAYNEEMTKWTVDEAVEHEKDGTGLGSMQEIYDKNQYGHVEEQVEEEEQYEGIGY